ncbi:hypothetical protein, partial [Streptomyces violascens]|uniref:hypothetical protein n=1 Tax=Streptomyces violascens TaxID=67381 RepID=UPI0036BAB54E
MAALGIQARGDAVVAVGQTVEGRLGAGGDDAVDRRPAEQGAAVNRSVVIVCSRGPECGGHRDHPFGTEPAAALRTLGQIRIPTVESDFDQTVMAALAHQPCDPEQVRILERTGRRRGDQNRRGRIRVHSSFRTQPAGQVT